MTQAHRVAHLKNEARKHYEAYLALADRYDCGHALAAHINPDVQRHADKFNEAMGRLAGVDPACPEFRLPQGGAA